MQYKRILACQGLPMALAWSNMQCIPTKEYAGSTFFRGCSVSLVIELKLVVRLSLRLELRISYNKIMKNICCKDIHFKKYVPLCGF